MMTDKFLSAVKKYSMLSPGDRVLIGLSGGADSMCLASLMLENASLFGITVEAAHINHCIRGAEADSDELFVRDFCAAKGIKLHILKIDVPAESKKTGESTELAARRIRYAYFESIAADKIATAHTGSDCIETMLINLSRGASLHGLASIPAVRGKIIRPLISCTRGEVENYCKKHSVAFVTDSTNLNNDYTRNKFRHNVLPALKEINPEFEHSAVRCIDLLRESDDFLNALAANELEKNLLSDGSLSLSGLCRLHRGLISRVIALFLSKCIGADFEAKHIDMIIEHMDGRFSVVLPGKKKLSCAQGRLFQEKPCSQTYCEETVFGKEQSSVFSFGEKSFSAYPSDSVPESGGAILAVLDFEKIGSAVTVRSRKPGDSLALAGRGCTKSLKKLFNEMKIPLDKRNSTAVFSDERGVIYIDGIGADLSRLPAKSAKKFLIIKTECGKNE